MAFRQAAQRVGLAVLWIYVIIKDGLDWVGRATLFEDADHTLGVVKHGLNWLFSTPWWVATGLAVIATGLLFWPNIREFFNRPDVGSNKGTTEAAISPAMPVDDTRPPKTGIPDWPIHELFTHIRPELLQRTDDRVGDTWDEVGGDIKDALALSRLSIWGRPEDHSVGKLLGERKALRKIDPNYWHFAHFTYSFFDSTAGDAPHTYVDPGHSEIAYTDLQINRAEALAIWPKGSAAMTDRPIINNQKNDRSNRSLRTSPRQNKKNY
jgi:hypothetical protein